LCTTTLLIDGSDDSEAIDDDDSPQWMDDKLENVAGEDDFGVVEDDANLDAPELEDILADVPRPTKGKGRLVESEETVEDDMVGLETSDDDSDAEWDWTT